MGSKHSTRHQNNLANELYLACCNGNIDRVREILPLSGYAEVNYVHPITGLSPLHVACSYGHHEIVQILLENTYCNRNIRNQNGNTPYDEATLTNIRSLFARSQSLNQQNRYIDDSTNVSPFHLITDNNSSSDRPDHWVTGYFASAEAVDSQLMLALSQAASPIMKFFLNARTERESREIVRGLIETNIPINNVNYQNAQNLYKQFIDKNSIEPLLTIYTLDTQFYTALQMNADAYAVLVYLHLQEIRTRAFQGCTYRGMNISHVDFEAYKWAYARAAVLQTRIFQSTSKCPEVAYIFGHHSVEIDRISIIMCFEFDKPCPSAIDLNGITHFNGEEEVLLLPFTLFRVISIKELIYEEHHYQKITLKNLPVPSSTLWASSRKKRN
ncbi:unnamed protein product [Rotaria sp. Silwood2]|nr:unnamed protein product [Rotaria sp. Silwood2]CAF3889977.1 unnamed protein product [Rotaria sp. Silwood2]